MVEEEKFRWHDERMTIYRFGRYVERSIRDNKEIKYIEIEFRKKYPDATLDVELKNGEKKQLSVEFEGHSSNFKAQHHDEHECDWIVCMFHDWKDSPLTVLELSSGKFFTPYEGIGGSFYEQLKKGKNETQR